MPEPHRHFTVSKSNQVYELIVNRLVTAQYGFGQRLLVKELAAETGASRQPIMSALNRLTVDGFVRIIPQVGCEVISPSPDEIGDFFLMFQKMEGLLAGLAAQRRSEEELRDLKAIQRQIQSLEPGNESMPDYVQLNRSFHHTIHLMAHSPLLDEKQRNNFNMCDFFITHSSGFGMFRDHAVAEHDQIINAIEARQVERAQLVAEAHISAIANSVLTALAKADKAEAEAAE